MKRLVVYFMLAGSALFWGATFNLAKVAVSYLPPFTIAAARFVIAATLMLILSSLTQKDIRATVARNWRAYLVMGLVGQVGFNLCLFVGMRYTSPTNGALIMATNPLVTALMAALVLREPISRRHKVGTLVSFAGVIAIVVAGDGKRLVGINLGDALVIVANVCMALYSITGKRFQNKSTAIMTTTWSMVAAVPALVLIALIFEPRAHLTGQPWSAYASVLAIAVLGSALAYIFWNYGIAQIGVSDTAVFFHLVPVFTVVLSFILGQRVTPFQLAAGSVVIVGVMISSGLLARLTSRWSAREINPLQRV